MRSIEAETCTVREKASLVGLLTAVTYLRCENADGQWLGIADVVVVDTSKKGSERVDIGRLYMLSDIENDQEEISTVDSEDHRERNISFSQYSKTYTTKAKISHTMTSAKYNLERLIRSKDGFPYQTVLNEPTRKTKFLSYRHSIQQTLEHVEFWSALKSW